METASSGSAMGSRSKDRAVKAMAAMSDMGFPLAKTKAILKQLLKTCENDWKYIEAENYRLLVEAIFESDEPEVDDPKEKKNSDDSMHSKKKEAPPPEEPEPCRKKLRARKEEGRPLTSVHDAAMSSRSVLSENKVAQQSNPRERSRQSTGGASVSADTSVGNGSVGPLSPSGDLQGKRVPAVPQVVLSDSDSVSGGAGPIDKDDELIGDSVLSEVPLAVVHPPLPWHTIEEGPPSNHPETHCERILPSVDPCTSELKALSPDQVANEGNRERSFSAVRNADGENDKILNVEESCPDAIEIVSSATGEGKILLSYNVVDCPNFQVPSLHSVVKKVEDKCLRSYKILDLNFSLMNIMKELCNTFLEMGTRPVESKEEDFVRITPLLDPLKFNKIGNLPGGLSTCSASSSGMRLPQGPEPMAMDGLKHIAQPNLAGKGTIDLDNALKEMNPCVPESSGSLILFHQHEPALGNVRPIHDIYDITKGEERVRITVVNEVDSEQCPPYFSYIPHNLVYQNAHLTFSLARIGDENCCSDCFGDCLSASIPCACARETSGVYAYTPEGLLKKGFLADCISMKYEPEKHQLFYCKDCPLEKSKNEMKPDPCKGHLVRKFIKECWSKCGCTKQCGNRVVQRGITCNMQVFFTPEGKGWGLRSLDDLPKGAFVCEYIGEVLTNMELYDRMVESTGNAKHTYPVLLDADWGSEGILRDEEALCLDATFYGNVARFINHRCRDANLVEVPVEVETPDHHYYHLAFFSTRKIEAFEELTWDYGIDFDDEKHPIKAFQCCCGSKFCRDRKCRKRTKSGAFVSR